MDEQAFLARVRKAVARPVPHFGELMNDHLQQVRQHSASHPSEASTSAGPAAAAPRYLGELLGLPDPDDQPALVDHWVQEFSQLGGQPVVVADGPGAVQALVQKVQAVLARRGGYCTITQHPLLTEWGLAEALEAAGLPFHVYDGENRAELAGASVGITVVSGAVAETGSFVIESHTHQGRLSSLLPPVYIGVVPPGTVAPGIAGWLTGRGARFRDGEEMPSSTVFATGPSRSADIAGDLALGVHGPGEVHAVVVRPS